MSNSTTMSWSDTQTDVAQPTISTFVRSRRSEAATAAVSDVRVPLTSHTAATLIQPQSHNAPATTESIPCPSDHGIYRISTPAPTESSREVVAPLSPSWWPTRRVYMVGPYLPNPRDGCEPPDPIDVVPAPWTLRTLCQMLAQYGVPLMSWVNAATKRLVEELTSGKAWLVVTKSGTLRCSVARLVLVVKSPRGDILVGGDSDEPDGDFSLEVTFSSREGVVEAARRCLHEKLKIPEHAVRLETDKVRTFDEEETGALYPGLTSTVRKYMLMCTVDAQMEISILHSLQMENLKALTKPSSTDEHHTEKRRPGWEWRSLNRIPGMQRHRAWLLQTEGSGTSASCSRTPHHRQSMMQTLLDDDVQRVLLPWSDHDVASVLREHGLDALSFGLSLVELTAALKGGQAYFGRSRSDGKLLCLADCVCLRITAPREEGAKVWERPCLVLTDGQDEIRWPGDMRRPDESHWATARRIARSQLQLHDVGLQINEASLYEVPSDQLSSAHGLQRYGTPGGRIWVRQFIVSATVAHSSMIATNTELDLRQLA